MLNGATAAADWLTRTLDLEGYRIDDVKGMAVAAVRQVLDSKSMAGRFAVGEYFDGNPSALQWWVSNSGMGGRCAVFDFTLHWQIQAMCNNSSRWWMGGLQGAGYIAIDPINAVTFCRQSRYGLVAWGKCDLEQVAGLCPHFDSEGIPGSLLQGLQHGPGLLRAQAIHRHSIWIHENLAFGSTSYPAAQTPRSTYLSGKVIQVCLSA